ALRAGGGESGGKQRTADALPAPRQLDERADDPDVIERARPRREGLDVLKADDPPRRAVEGHMKDASRRETAHERPLLVQRKGRVHGRMTARRDDRVQNTGDA